jgi:carbon monoxide dehydrogenase subunit G
LLLIADISGYTRFLQASELDHARGILTDLLGVLVDQTRPPLVISRLEGDAVFSYQLSTVSGQTVVEMLEATYVAFRRAIELIVLNTTCECNACANVGTLDLKFFVHHGEFALQQIGERRELLGTPVNTAHRLTKNTVKEKTGITAYTLWTDAAFQALDLTELGKAWVPHREVYDDVGQVDCRVQDMHPVWLDQRDRSETSFAPDEVLVEGSVDIPLPPEIVWDRLADPVFRSVLMGVERQEIEPAANGRTGEGGMFVCHHGGNRVTPQVIVEWRPFERVVTKDKLPFPGGTTFIHVVYRLEPTAGGTRLSQAFARPSGPAYARLATRLMGAMMRKWVERDLLAFAKAIEALPEPAPADRV